MPIKEVIQQGLKDRLESLQCDPTVGIIVEDAIAFASKTTLTPWAEVDWDKNPDLAILINRYVGDQESWDAFCLAIRVERLLQEK